MQAAHPLSHHFLRKIRLYFPRGNGMDVAA
jgi:hypothetical protein